MAANLKQKQEEIGGIMSSKTVLISLKHFDMIEMCFFSSINSGSSGN